MLLLLLLGLASAEMLIVLPQRNLDVLQQRVLNISDYTNPMYGKYMDISQIMAMISPPEYIVHETHNYLVQRGHVCKNYKDALLCNGTIDKVPHGIVYTPKYNSIDEVVPKSHVKGKDPVDPGYVGREVLMRLYNMSLDNVTESLGSIEYQGSSGFSADDLQSSQTANGQPTNPISPDHIIGHNKSPDTESELDVQMQSQTASMATLWFDGDANWLLGWAIKFFNTEAVPYVVSHSWGWATDQQCTITNCNSSSTYVDRVNIEFLKIAARGVTMVVASGDSGAPGRSAIDCSTDERKVVPIFPGSSPWVLSAGATFVETSNATVSWTTSLCKQYGCPAGTDEATINTEYVGWTAGGGFGNYADSELRTPWQDKAVKQYFQQGLPLPPYFNASGRGYPDMAVVGHNCPTWYYGLMPVDGTSCSSPIISGIIASINAHQVARGRARVGLVAPLLYAMFYDDPTLYNDITVGNNWCTEDGCCPVRADGGSDYGYLASKGWDPVTGLGTPNVGRMLEWLDNHGVGAGN